MGRRTTQRLNVVHARGRKPFRNNGMVSNGVGSKVWNERSREQRRAPSGQRKEPAKVTEELQNL